MYLYDVYGYECHCILTHEKKFTQEEFRAMCEEGEKRKGLDGEYFGDDKVIIPLIKNHGFKKAEIAADFMTDM